MNDDQQDLEPHTQSKELSLRTMASEVEVSPTGALIAKKLSDIMALGEMMARGGAMVGKSFRGRPGACCGIIIRSMAWQMDPYSVSQQAYVTIDKDGNEVLAFMAQLISAVVLKHAPIAGRPRFSFSGVGPTRSAQVSCRIKGEDQDSIYISPPMASIKGRSPLWEKDVDQQLSYYGIRAWARRFTPEILMGVYSKDEIEDAEHVEVTHSERIESQVEQSDMPDPADRSMMDAEGREHQIYLARIAAIPTGLKPAAFAEGAEAVKIVKAWEDRLRAIGNTEDLDEEIGAMRTVLRARISNNRIYALNEIYEEHREQIEKGEFVEIVRNNDVIVSTLAEMNIDAKDIVDANFVIDQEAEAAALSLTELEAMLTELNKCKTLKDVRTWGMQMTTDDGQKRIALLLGSDLANMRLKYDETLKKHGSSGAKKKESA